MITIPAITLSEKPRERLIKYGAQSLTDSELLAIIINTGTAKQSVLQIAQSLLSHFGSLNALLNANTKELMVVPGIGITKSLQIKAAMELTTRSLTEPIQAGAAFLDYADVEKFLLAKLKHQAQEVFACLFLTNKHQLIAYEELFWGGINSITVHPREVVKRALSHNAAATIIAHNHPSGDPKPSLADHETTQTIKRALDLVDIRLLDHFVVGHSDVFSLAQAGRI